MTPLPWGWLKAAFHELHPPAMPTIDRAAQDEAVAFNAIVAHWDDHVPCRDTSCQRPAYWVYHCGCGLPVVYCTPHKVWMDMYLLAHPGKVCRFCERKVPEPIPWLPL